MAALGQAAADSGALVLTRTLARELRHDGQGRITAVICERPDGTRESIGCDALILACNGFGGNAAMVREHLPAMADAVYGGHAGNDGSAVRWGRAGRGPGRYGRLSGHGSWATPQGALVSWAVIMDGGVQVNRLGLRFRRDPGLFGSGGARAGAAGRRGLACSTTRRWRWCGLSDFQAARAAGALHGRRRAGAGRADRLRCAGAGRYAAVGGKGAPDVHGRRFTRALSAPYHAVKVTGALFHTQGGLDIDARCRVRRADGGLFRTCWRRVLRAACRATTWRAICRATACSAPSRAAISPPRRPPGSRAWRWPMSRLRSGARPQACA